MMRKVERQRDGLLAACKQSLHLLEVRLGLVEIADEEKAHIDTLRRAIQAKGG